MDIAERHSYSILQLRILCRLRRKLRTERSSLESIHHVDKESVHKYKNYCFSTQL